jgi:hypothetical protein
MARSVRFPANNSPIEIYVRNITGKRITLDFCPTDRIEDLKAMIAGHQQRLLRNGRLLEDWNTPEHEYIWSAVSEGKH